jgi:hypothetical protein
VKSSLRTTKPGRSNNNKGAVGAFQTADKVLDADPGL